METKKKHTKVAFVSGKSQTGKVKSMKAYHQRQLPRTVGVVHTTDKLRVIKGYIVLRIPAQFEEVVGLQTTFR